MSDVKTIETLEKASSLSRSETKSLNQRIKVKHEDLEFERKRLPQFNEISDAENAISHINDLEGLVKTLGERMKKLEAIKEKRESFMYQTNFITAIQDVSFPQVNVQGFRGIKDLERIRREKNRLKIMEGIVGVGLTSFPTIPSVEVNDHKPLESVLKKRIDLSQTIQSISRMEIDLPEVNTQIEKDLRIASERFDLYSRISRTEQEVGRLTEELEAIKCEIGDTCPLCEQGIDH